MIRFDPRLADAATASPAPALPASAFPDGDLARQEWEVIALARRDGLATLREPSRLARLGAWLFGTEASRRLANPRLEALRRFAVLAWHHGYALPMSAIKTMKEAGFSIDQIELLLAGIAAGRARPARSVRA